MRTILLALVFVYVLSGPLSAMHRSQSDDDIHYSSRSGHRLERGYTPPYRLYPANKRGERLVRQPEQEEIVPRYDPFPFNRIDLNDDRSAILCFLVPIVASFYLLQQFIQQRMEKGEAPFD